MTNPSTIADQGPSPSPNSLLAQEDLYAVVCRECRQEVIVTRKCPLCGHLAYDHDTPQGEILGAGRVSKGVFCRYYEECHCALHPDSFIHQYDEGRAGFFADEKVPWFKRGPLLRLNDAKLWVYDKRERPDKKYLIHDWHDPEPTAEIITAKSGSEALDQYRALRGWVSKKNSNVKLLREGDEVVGGKIVRKRTENL